MKNNKYKLTINRDWTRIMNVKCKYRRFDKNNIMKIYYVSYIKTQDETLRDKDDFDLFSIIL